ncbi:cell division protein ZipA, partial [Vibrio harveyi]
EIPAFVATKTEEDVVEAVLQESVDTFAENETIAEKEEIIEPVFETTVVPESAEVEIAPVMTEVAVEEPKPEPEMQVIVLNVHCAGEEPFIGTKLFDSLQQNGLIYGEMNIFHRHVDLSGNGKVLFSVANMMQPGTLEHGDPAEFSTKGISFFMTLPCYGEADQNFNLMLRIAQQVADDMGGNVLDDQRNLMTPDRLASYRRQIVEFNAANA